MAKQSHPYTNELANETSPYLIQHAHNPVNWYPWGDKALDLAGKENKLLIISIGYAACHWCHVMEHESFEDTTVARLMNENYVSIKVDREERPDVDQVYMNAPGVLIEQAEKVTQGIQSLDMMPMNTTEQEFSQEGLDAVFDALKAGLDLSKGGMNRAPKFPMPSVWEYLLHYHHMTGKAEVLKAITVTLENMALGGINRNYKEGRSTIPGFLDDYAFVITAFTELYQSTFDEQWLDRAHQLTGYTIENFSDEVSGMFFYTHRDHSGLIARNMETSDNVIPASNSEMARNLFRLGHYFYNDDYTGMARQMLMNVREDAHQNIFYFSNWGILETHFVHQPFEVAILGDGCMGMRQSLDEHYLPFVLLSGGKETGSLELLQNKGVPGSSMIYVCRDKVCKLPVKNVSEALDQLNR